MLHRFALYDAIGTLVQMNTCDEVTFAAMPPGGGFQGLTLLEITDPITDPLNFIEIHYVAGGVIVPKQTVDAVVSESTIVADGIDTTAITRLPVPCTVTISGALAAGPFEVTDGELDLTCDHAGDIVVSVTADPAYLPWSTTIHAT
jgi:hypothetical protein